MEKIRLIFYACPSAWKVMKKHRSMPFSFAQRKAFGQISTRRLYHNPGLDVLKLNWEVNQSKPSFEESGEAIRELILVEFIV